MSQAETRTVSVGLNGSEFRVEVRRSGGYEDAGIRDVLPIDAVMKIVGELGIALDAAISRAAPKKAAVEFGMALELENGKLVALVCQGKTTANFTVKLEWER